MSLNPNEQIVHINNVHRNILGIFNSDLMSRTLSIVRNYLNNSTITIEEFKKNATNLSDDMVERIQFIYSKLAPDQPFDQAKIYPGGRKILIKNLNTLLEQNFYASDSYFNNYHGFPPVVYNDGASILLEDILLANGIIYPMGNPLTAHLYMPITISDIHMNNVLTTSNPYVALSAQLFMSRYSTYLRRILEAYYTFIGNIPHSLTKNIFELKEEVSLLQQRPMELSEFVNPYGW
jgi:hypothetical protein